jgi:purine-binding chemotaxis protein CheW
MLEGRMAGAGRGHQKEILVFALADQRYALWVKDVREVLRAVAIVPLPRAPRLVEGVIDLRGRLVPVLDLRGHLGLPSKPLEPSDHLIVSAPGGKLAAIRVDRALDLVAIDPGELGTDAFHGDYLAGVARLPDGLTIIHDLATFLNADERAALDSALAAGAPG